MSTNGLDTVEAIRTRVNLHELASDLGLAKLRKVGQSWVACCPFHDDHEPSLHFFESPSPSFHCFSCGAHGDAFSLVRKIKNVNFRDALQWLASYAGMSVETARSSALQQSGLELAWHHYKGSSGAGKNVLKQWIENRNLSEEKVKDAELVGIKSSVLTKRTSQQKYLAGWDRWEWEALEDVGLVRTRSGADSTDNTIGHLPIVVPEDIFWYEGILFPLRDANGVLAGFVVRKTESSDYHGPKYRFSRGFKRSHCLYGMDRVIQRVFHEPKSDRAFPVDLFVVEGLVDVLRLEQHGYNAVGLLGNSLSGDENDVGSQFQQLISLKKRLGDRPLNVHLFLDADEPGQEGMVRTVLRLVAIQLQDPLFHVDCIVPRCDVTGKDPDDLLRDLSMPSGRSALLDWRTPVAAFALVRVLGKDAKTLSDYWGKLSYLQKSQAAVRVGRMLTGGAPISPRFLTAVAFGDERDESKELWAIELTTVLSNIALPAASAVIRQPLQESRYAGFARGLQLARDSYRDIDFCSDTGSWRRLELGGDLVWETLANRLSRLAGPLEPYAPSLTPRSDGGEPRLKVLPCPEDLVLENYVLWHLLYFAATNPDTIPLVLHDADRAETLTVGPPEMIPSHGTVSFAYQFNRSAVGEGNINEAGLFRHFAQCWHAFTDFILGRVMKCPEKQETLYVARLDIRRYYDTLSRQAILEVLNPSLNRAVQRADRESIVPDLDDPSQSIDERVTRFRRWLLQDRSFGYKWYHPQDGSEQKWPSADTGIPQGPNLSSWLANIALFPLDRALSEEVAAINEKHFGADANAIVATYARYVDDIIIIAPTSEAVNGLRLSVARKLDSLGMRLSPKVNALPPMSPSEVRGWLLQNRGIGDTASGDWTLPSRPSGQSMMQVQIGGGVLDRRDALALLHSEDLNDISLSKESRVATIETIAKHSDEVRYRDYQAIAKSLWLLLVQDFSKEEPPSVDSVACKYWDLWQRHVKSINRSSVSSEVAGQRATNAVVALKDAVDSLWPLLAAMEGLQKALLLRQDLSPTRTTEQQKVFGHTRHILADLVLGDLLTELMVSLIRFRDGSGLYVELLQGVIAARELAVRRVAATIKGKLSFGDRCTAHRLTCGSIRLPAIEQNYRLALSCAGNSELQDMAPYGGVDVDRDRKEILLFHECIERLSHNHASPEQGDPLDAVRLVAQGYCESTNYSTSLAKSLFLLCPVDGNGKSVCCEDGILLRTLNVFARCVPPRRQMPLLEKRGALVRAFSLEGKYLILPTPEGVSTRALLICGLNDLQDAATCLQWVVHGRSADEIERLRVEDVIVPEHGVQDWRESKIENTPFMMYKADIDHACKWCPTILSQSSDLVAVAALDLTAMADAFQTLALQRSVKDVVLAHSHVLTRHQGASQEYGLFSWKEGAKKLEGKAFISRYGSNSTVLGDVPVSNDWVWRVGHTVVGIFGLSWLVDQSEEGRLGKPADVDISDWAKKSITYNAIRSITGKYWWSRTESNKIGSTFEANNLRLPRVVEDCIKRLRLFGELNCATNGPGAASLVLCGRADTTAMSLLKNYRDMLDRPGLAAFLIAGMARSVMRADEGLVEILRQIAGQPRHLDVEVRRAVEAWYSCFHLLMSIKDQVSTPECASGNRGLAASAGLFAVTSQMRAFVLEYAYGARNKKLSYEGVARDHKSVVSGWPVSANAALVLSRSTADDACTVVESAARWFDDVVRSVTPLQSMCAFDTVTPLGWCVLHALTDLMLGSNLSIASSASGDVYAKHYPEIMILLSGCEESKTDDYPWGILQETCVNWANYDTVHSKLTWLAHRQKALGLQVSTKLSGTCSIKDVRDGYVEFRTISGDERRLFVHQLAYSTLGGERGSGYEREVMPDGVVRFTWTESYLAGSLVGASIISGGLAKFDALCKSIKVTVDLPEDVDTVDDKNLTPEAAQSGATDMSGNLQQATSSRNAVGANAPASAQNTTGARPDLELREWQDVLWNSRGRRYGHHLRIAFFQHDVDETYSHPLSEVCVRDSQTGEFDEDLVAAKRVPSIWKKTADIGSCAEYRRRQLLAEVIRACKSFSVDILLLPEYSVRPETVSWLSAQLGDGLTVWAGTFRIPSEGMDTTGVFSTGSVSGVCVPSAAIIPVVSQVGVQFARGKRYPSVAAGEQFRPFMNDHSAIGALYHSVPTQARRCEPGDFVTELICSEIFMATSPANLCSLTQALARLHTLYADSPPSADDLHFIAKAVVSDLHAFASSTAMAPDFDVTSRSAGFHPFFPRRTILLVPGMSSRAVDFQILGQANNLAAGMCVVFCNAVCGQFGKGGSCFIGNGAIDVDSKHAYNDLRIGPYNGVHPGIFRDGAFRKGAVGDGEQALVIVDVDPVYMNEGKPRQQLLPPPLSLVAHLPVIEYAEEGLVSWVKKRKDQIERLDYECCCTKRGGKLVQKEEVLGLANQTAEFLNLYSREPRVGSDANAVARIKAIKLLLQLEKLGKTSPWLQQRRVAFDENQGLIRSMWPPPSVYDYLPVCVAGGAQSNDHKPSFAPLPRIEVRAVNPVNDDRLGGNRI